MNYQISKWASQHKLYAQIIIFTLHIVLILSGAFTGKILSMLNLYLPISFLIAVLSIFALIALFYPQKNILGKYEKNVFGIKIPFKKRKLFDFIIAICSFLSVIYFTNNINKENKIPMLTISSVFSEEISDKQVLAEDNKIFSADKRITGLTVTDWRKTKLKDIVKKQKTENEYFNRNEFNWPLFGIIILTVLLVAIATWGLGILACSIACGGYEALALFVFFAGEIGVLLLGFYGIRGFIRKQRLKRNESVQEKEI